MRCRSLFLEDESAREPRRDDADPRPKEQGRALGDSPATVRTERDRVFRKLAEVVSRFSDDDLARPAAEFGLEEPGKSLVSVLTEYHGAHFAEHRGHVERIAAQA